MNNELINDLTKRANEQERIIEHKDKVIAGMVAALKRDPSIYETVNAALAIADATYEEKK